MTAKAASIAPDAKATPASSAEIMAEWRAGWKPGLAAFVAGAIGVGLWVSLSSLFIEPLRAEFGWTRSQIAFAFNASIVVALLSPMMGRMVDKIGARIVVLGSVSLLGLAYVGLGLLWGSLPLFYAIYLFAMIVGSPGGGMSFNRVISQTFVKSRGLALAVTRSGMAIAAAGMPPLIYIVIAEHGWRSAFAVLAAMLLLIALPLCFFCLPDDRPVRERTQSAGQTEKRQSVWALASNPKVAIICLATGLGYAPCIALLQSSQPILVDKGVEPMTAAALIGAIGAAAFISGLVGGILVDRLWAPLVTCGAMMFGMAGCLLIMPATISPGAAWLGAIALGAAQGSQIQVTAYLIARYCGFSSYSTIFGMVIMVIAVLTPLYLNLITIMYEALGSHMAGISLCLASFGAAMILILTIGRYPHSGTVD